MKNVLFSVGVAVCSGGVHLLSKDNKAGYLLLMLGVVFMGVSAKA